MFSPCIRKSFLPLNALSFEGKLFVIASVNGKICILYQLILFVCILVGCFAVVFSEKFTFQEKEIFVRVLVFLVIWLMWTFLKFLFVQLSLKGLDCTLSLYPALSLPFPGTSLFAV